MTPPDTVAAKKPAASAAKTLPLTGREYLDSLDDGREIWIYGERVKKITEHPAFQNCARMIARLYDALFRNLEFKERHDAMVYKLHAVDTVMEMLIDVWQARRSLALEWAIVLLIIFEIGLALVEKA